MTGYLGLLLMGGCFLSLGLLISSLTKNQIVAGMVTFAVFLMLWVINWMGSFVGPTAQAVLGASVDHRSLRRLRARHHRHQTPGLLPELYCVRAVPHRQVGGQRTVAGLMVNSIIGIIGWIGTALVFGAVGIRFLRPEWMQYGTYLAWAGLVCVLLYMVGQWRDVVGVLQQAAGALRHDDVVSILVGLGIVVAVNYLGVRQNKRWDLTANQVYSLSEQTVKMLKGLDAPVKFTVYDQRNQLRSIPRSARRVRLRVEERQRRVRGHRPAAGAREAGRGADGRHDRDLIQGPRAADLEHRRAGHHQRAHQGDEPAQQKKIYFTQGHGEKDTGGADRLGYAVGRGGARTRQLHGREAGAGAAEGGAGRRHGRRHRRPAHRLPAAGDRRAQDNTSPRAARCW